MRRTGSVPLPTVLVCLEVQGSDTSDGSVYYLVLNKVKHMDVAYGLSDL